MAGNSSVSMLSYQRSITDQCAYSRMCPLVTLAAARGNVACLRLAVALVLAGDDNLREIDDDHTAWLLADISSWQVHVDKIVGAH